MIVLVKVGYAALDPFFSRLKRTLTGGLKVQI
jgi:hypothetical protein